MINRVFCYSNDEAKKNGNNTSAGKMLAQIAGMVLLFCVIQIIFVSISIGSSDDSFSNYTFSLISIIIFLVIIASYIIYCRSKFYSQLTGFATDTDNNIYFVIKLNNAASFAIGGIAVGNSIDRALDKSNSLAGDVAQGTGAVLAWYSLNKSVKIMQNPEIIAKMVECATTTTGAEIRQILKIHNYEEDSRKVKIKCDYKIMNNGRIKCNKTINVYKSYNCFNQLMDNLLSKRRE